MEAALDPGDRVPVGCAPEHVGEAGERRVALEEGVACQQAVPVPVEHRVGSDREAPVLILEGMRQLVREEKLADQVPPRDRRQEAEEADRVERTAGKHETLLAGIVESSGLLLVDPLERGAQSLVRGEEAKVPVDRLEVLEVGRRVALVDLASERRADVGGGHREGRNGRTEGQPTDVGQRAANLRDRLLVHLPTPHHAARPAPEHEGEEERRRSAHGSGFSMRIAGYPRRLTSSARATATPRNGYGPIRTR